MWRGFKLGVILLVFHSAYAAEDYFDLESFDLRSVIPGEPEIDYPIFSVAPRTSFTCIGRHEGYYADMEARCQVFRICSNTDFTGRGFPFLCPNGTIFNQKHFVCDWYKNVDCDGSGEYFYKNSENALESKEQMMKKALEMIEFPMKSLMKNQHYVSTTSTTTSTTTRQPAVTKIVNTPAPTHQQTIEAVTKPAYTRVTNNPEQATQGEKVFVSSLGELSSDVRTTFNPDTSVILNTESPSRFLEAPRFLDLASFASNINGLVDDVEADGGLIPNVLSVRSPKIPSLPVKSKGFSMPQNYRKIQEEQAKLNPTVQPVFTAPPPAPVVNNYQQPIYTNPVPIGRSYQNFYPQQQPVYYNLPRSLPAAVTPQTQEISFHNHKLNPDIVIARSEEHSPFPLESRTARATPAPPSQYVPLKQYLNQNFYQTQKSYPNYSYTQPQKPIQYKPLHGSSPQPQRAVQYKAPVSTIKPQKPIQYKAQPQGVSTQPQYKTQLQPSTINKISTVQEKLPLFPPLLQPQQQPQTTKKQSFQTYQQFAFKTIPIAQRRFGLAEFDEDKKPNFSLFNGVSSYDVPLSSIGILRSVKQQRLQNTRVQG